MFAGSQTTAQGEGVPVTLLYTTGRADPSNIKT
jgi:hypothetical protein